MLTPALHVILNPQKGAKNLVARIDLIPASFDRVRMIAELIPAVSSFDKTQDDGQLSIEIA